MKIGFTYCAGCRSQKTDITVFEQLLKYLMEKGASLAEKSSSYDYIFCLCGCPCKCASLSGYQCDKKIYRVDRNIDLVTFEEIKREIEQG